MSILGDIVAAKKEHVRKQRQSVRQALLERTDFFRRSPLSLRSSLQEKPGIIAEFKRKSPSRGEIKPQARVDEIVFGYQDKGASAVSILTDRPYFEGENSDIESVRGICEIPILRKDFLIDEYQVYEAKAIGADVILLIARILDRPQLKDYTSLAHELGLEVLLEIHSMKEFDRYYSEDIDILGVNNRDLDTLEMNLKLSQTVLQELPPEQICISESGIQGSAVAKELLEKGYHGLLIGEYFMSSADPVKAFEIFMNEVLS